MSHTKKIKCLLGVVVSVSLSACTLDNWYEQDRGDRDYGTYSQPRAHHHQSEARAHHHQSEARVHHRHEGNKAVQQHQHVSKKTPVAVKKTVVQPSAPGPVRQAAPQIPVIQ